MCKSFFKMEMDEDSEVAKYNEVFDYLASKSYPEGYDKGKKLVIRRRSKDYQICKGKLCYIGHMKRKKSLDPNIKPRQVISRREEQVKIIKAIHELGHFGRDKIISQVSYQYYWKTLYTDVVSLILSCDVCQRVKRKFDKPSLSLHPVPVKCGPWKQVGIDLVGPLPKTLNGNKYIMTVTDYFSKWPEAKAIPSKEACQVADFLHSLFLRHGFCPCVISDQGREFCNQVSDKLFELTDTEHRVTSAYHPQSNGLAERFNQTLIDSLVKKAHDKQHEWDKHIDSVLFAYRTSKHRSTKMTPFFIMHIREANLEVGDEQVNLTISEDGIEEKISELVAMKKKVDDVVDKNIKHAQDVQKRTYDAKHNTKTTIKVGDQVLMKNMKNSHRMGGKLDIRWTGPYKVVEDCGKMRYRVKNFQNGELEKKTVHCSRLKPYLEQSDSIEGQKEVEDKRMTVRKRAESAAAQKLKIPCAKRRKTEVNAMGKGLTLRKRARPAAAQKLKIPCAKNRKIEVNPTVERMTSRKRAISVAAQKWKIRRAKKRKTESKPGPEIDLTLNDDLNSSDNENQESTEWKKIGFVKLYEKDRTILESDTDWLTDNIVNATQVLLQRKYGTPGLQNTALGYTFSYDVVGGIEFVQVLNSANSHWLAVSTIGCPYSHVKVYDSLYPDIPTSTKEQICALLASTESNIHLEFVNVQLQTNGCDCGLFSLAFSTALCAGQDPQNLHFDNSQMRHHLLACLEKDEIQPFPSKQVQRRPPSKRKDTIEIFCKCRTQEGGEMLECCNCTEWFHEECLKLVPQEAWINPNFKWYCDQCAKDGDKEDLHMEPEGEAEERPQKQPVPEGKKQTIIRATKKVKMPTFTKEMRKLLADGKELTNHHIHLAQRMLVSQFPTIDGLQSPTLSLSTIDGLQQRYRSIQIHSAGEDHWVVSSSFGQEVALYDSDYSSDTFSATLTNQLAIIYKPLILTVDEDGSEIDPELSVSIPDVQKQQDCNSGVFAIAFSLHLARGDDLECMLFEESQMRNHLRKCFYSKKFEPFPHKKVPCIPKHQLSRADYLPFYQIELICVCLMPKTWDSVITCDECQECYHIKCVLTQMQGNDKWVCSKCKIQ